MQRISSCLICIFFSFLFLSSNAYAIDDRKGPSPGRLFITSNPPGGELILDREELGQLPVSVENIRAGKHDVRISKPGYTYWYQRMDIAPGTDYWINAQLVKDIKYNRLDIASEPSGAQVFLDNQYRGNTPITIFFIPAGEHHIVILKDSLSWQGKIRLEAGDKESISAELIEEERGPPAVSFPEIFFVERMVQVGMPAAVEGYPGWLFITSDPPDAHLILDEELVGKVPQTVEDLTPGIHFVRIQKKGYADWYQRMYIAPGKNYRITARLTKEAEPNRLEVISSPDGAEVYFDGMYRGDTPLSILYVPEGTHEVSILRDSLSWYGDVNVESHEMKTINAVLFKQETVITVLSPLESLFVEVDDQLIGIAPCEFSVETGKKKFRFWRGKDQESVRNLVVSSGQKIRIDIQRIMDHSLFNKKEREYSSKKRRYFILGLISAGGSVGLQILKGRAYDEYMESTTLSDIEENFDTARRYQIISFSLAGVSLYSFVRNFFDDGPRSEAFETIEISRE